MSLGITHVLCLSISNSLLFPLSKLSVSLTSLLVLLGKEADILETSP